jgi:NAD(P)-dependent dehydrogenase (short-subunit alcohol dehydrogenase family)
MDRVGVVTGGASGMGLSICEHLVRRGDAAAVLDLRGAEEAAEKLQTRGGRAVGVTVDVADRAAVDAALQQVRAELGPVEILVTCAALSIFTDFMEMSVEEWERTLAVNLTGTFHCIQLALPDMLAAGWGRIVTISSSAAQVGGPKHAHYAASKGGVIGLTRALSLDYARRGITVNCIAPHYIDTPMFRAGLRGVHGEGDAGAAADLGVSRLPVGRIGTGDDIAAACMYLTSDEAGFITGQLHGVNGGALP